MNSRNCLYVLLASLILAGCMSMQSGTRIEQAQVDSIKKGVTTKAEVEAKFGEATNSVSLGDGREQVVYSYHETQDRATNYIPFAPLVAGAGVDTKRQMLTITYDKNQVVEDVRFQNVVGQGHGNMFGGSTYKEKSVPASQ